MLQRENITLSLNIGHLGRAVGRRLTLFSVGLFCALGQPRRLCAQPLELDLTVERTPRAMDCADQSELRAKVERLTQRAHEDPATVNRLTRRAHDGTGAKVDGHTQRAHDDPATANRLTQPAHEGTTAEAPVEVGTGGEHSSIPLPGDVSPSHGKASELRQSAVSGSETLRADGATSGSPHVASNANVLRVVARFDRTRREYLADVQFSGAKPGERRLSDRGSECTSLEDAVAVSVALLLDREQQRREEAPSAALRAVPTIKISRGRVVLPTARNISRAWFVAAKTGPVWGTTDGPSVVVALDFGVIWNRQWQLELGASHVAPKTIGYGPGEVTVSIWAAEVRGCKSWGRSFFVGV
ncbi:MAG TPA: hypothetical protein VKP30_03210, partial [Polyangiaceae bacterium]|nr:hypothetical protein [Polyangiaceae bacterium]